MKIRAEIEHRKKNREEKLDFINLICVWVREGTGTPLQYSCLENPMDRGAW